MKQMNQMVAKTKKESREANGFGIVLPFCVPRKPQAQGILGSICTCAASRYYQLKSNRADFLPRARNMNIEQSMSYEFVYGLNFVQIHLT